MDLRSREREFSCLQKQREEDDDWQSQWVAAHLRKATARQPPPFKLSPRSISSSQELCAPLLVLLQPTKRILRFSLDPTPQCHNTRSSMINATNAKQLRETHTTIKEITQLLANVTMYVYVQRTKTKKWHDMTWHYLIFAVTWLDMTCVYRLKSPVHCLHARLTCSNTQSRAKNRAGGSLQGW